MFLTILAIIAISVSGIYALYFLRRRAGTLSSLVTFAALMLVCAVELFDLLLILDPDRIQSWRKLSLLAESCLPIAWLLFGLVFPAVGLGYNAVTIGGKNSATLGQRMMGLEVRMWYGGKVTPLVAAFHALLFWFAFVVFCPILLWALFDSRKRCLHDILAGVLFINRP